MTEMPEPTRWASRSGSSPTPTFCSRGSRTRRPGPEARYETKEAIALAFIVGLQHLPPQQRAVLVLRDVLGYRAAEVAEMLETSEASVNSLLRRARAAFESRLPAGGRERAPLPNSKLEREIVGRFAEAVEAGDVDGMVALLTEDAWLTMPPLPHAYQGRDAIGVFLRGREVAPRRAAAARADTRERPARVRVLPARPADRTSRGRTRCSSSPSRAIRSPRSPGSPTAASSRTSGCRGCCARPYGVPGASLVSWRGLPSGLARR